MEATLGVDHPDSARVIGQPRLYAGKLGPAEEAMEYFRRALVTNRSRLTVFAVLGRRLAGLLASASPAGDGPVCVAGYRQNVTALDLRYCTHVRVLRFLAEAGNMT